MSAIDAVVQAVLTLLAPLEKEEAREVLEKVWQGKLGGVVGVRNQDSLDIKIVAKAVLEDEEFARLVLELIEGYLATREDLVQPKIEQEEIARLVKEEPARLLPQHSPAKKIEKGKGRIAPAPAEIKLSPEETRRLLNAASADNRRERRLRLMVNLLFFSLRDCDEVASFRVSQVDFEKGLIKQAPFPKALGPVLKQYLSDLRTGQDLLFLTRHGNPFGYNAFYSVLRKAMEIAGLEIKQLTPASWHQFSLGYFAQHLKPEELVLLSGLDPSQVMRFYPDEFADALEIESVDAQHARQSYEKAASLLLEKAPVAMETSLEEQKPSQPQQSKAEKPAYQSGLDLKALWQEAKSLDPEEELMVKLAVTVGLLPEELARIKKEQVFPESIFIESTKAAKGRAVPLPLSLRALTRNIKAMPNGSKLLFAVSHPQDILEVLRKAARRAGCQGQLEPEAWREALFRYLAKAGWSVAEVAFLAGLSQEDAKRLYFDPQGLPGEIVSLVGENRPTRQSIQPKLEKALADLLGL